RERECVCVCGKEKREKATPIERHRETSTFASMAAENKFFESYKKALTTAASVAASMMLARTVVNEVIPYELRDYIFSRFDCLRSRLSSEHTIVIDQAEGYASNLVFDAARTYLSTRINRSMRSLRVSMVEEGKNMVVSLEPGEEMIDVYQDIEFKWQLISQQVDRSSSHINNRFSGSATETKSFVVSFHQKHKDKILHSYLPFILEQAKAIREQDRTLQLHMNEEDGWCPINLHHPSTFDTLAMDPKLKAAVMEDLARFVKRKDYYSRIGKAWKRGYLLYGPPGTGKSSLIAAMANYLKFDIYDLELAEVNWNTTLRRLLVGMPNRSILVVEDIDCSVNLQKRDERESDATSPSTSNDDKQSLTRDVCSCVTDNAVGVAQLHRRAMVDQRRRANHRVDHQLQGSTRPCSSPTWQNGHAHSHGLLRASRVQSAGLQLPRHRRAQLVCRHRRADTGGGGDPCGGRRTADAER
ncbi:unnamed protein product, partial [Musa acuminata subsp. malaccensis]